jgi:hypothetical protein
MSNEGKTGWIETISPLVKGKGTTLNVNGHTYNFRANEWGDFVAEIPFPSDYAAILSISAGYKPYEADQEHPEGLPQSEEAPLLPQSRKTPHSKDAKNLMPETPKRGPGRPATPRPGVAAIHAAPMTDPAAG